MIPIPDNLVEREIYLSNVVEEYKRECKMNNAGTVIVTVVVMGALIILGTWLCLGV